MTSELAEKLFGELSGVCGFQLIMVDGSVSGDGVFASATARARQSPVSGSLTCLAVRAELLCTAVENGGVEIWALVFFYVNGVRVAPEGANHLTFEWVQDESGVSRWALNGWEADVYDEWSGADRLDDEW